MRGTLALWERLIDDAAMVQANRFQPDRFPVADVVGAHREHRKAWYGFAIGPLVVNDRRLAEVGRATTPEPLAVSVVNTTGAGGLVSLAGRAVDGVQVVSVESALRDLGDLTGNAARVVAAAVMLEEDVRVFIEIPYAPGWERAVAVVEDAGLYAKLRIGGEQTGALSADHLAQQLSVLIEADLPFKATADSPHPDHSGFLQVVVAIADLIDGAGVNEAAEVLRSTDGRALAERISDWSEADATRVRRRLRSFGCPGVLDLIGDLVVLDVLSASE